MSPYLTPTPTPPAPRVPSGPAPDRVDPRSLLAAYPHVARCPNCRAYADEHEGATADRDVVWAALAHHDSGHRLDPLTRTNPSF